MLFEDFEPSKDDLRIHSNRVNKIISDKEYLVFISHRGEEENIPAFVDVRYQSSNTKENSSTIKIDFNKDKYLEFKTYIGHKGKIELSIYKDWGILLDYNSVEDIIKIYDDIKDYIGLSYSQIMLISKILNTKVRAKEDHLSLDFTI